MLSEEENRLITQVGAGTPMGELFRRYWLPAMLAEELPEPDCPPVKLRLLGEDLVAFRVSSGKVGVLQTYCPHRNANLYWGRNEEEGLRCVYHGWKFDIEGQCVDMPNEPPSSSFASKIRQPAYPAVERAGLVWVYMGPPDLAPKLPDFEWMHLAPPNLRLHKRFQLCNWLQNLEGEVDSSHAPFLHGRLGPDGKRETPSAHFADTRPVFFVQETAYGLVMGARRDAGPDDYYWRVTPMLLPSYALVAGMYMFTAAVPGDDTTTIGLTAVWDPEKEVSPDYFDEWCPVDEHYRPTRNKANEYLISRFDQKTVNFTGIRGTRVQDMAVQEDQRGPVSDRSQEHLGSADAGVIATRRLLLKRAQELMRGREPWQPHNPGAYLLRAPGVTLDRSISFAEVVAKYTDIPSSPATPTKEVHL